MSELVQNPICPKCRKSYPAGTNFCDVDGTRLTVSADSKLTYRCGKCGREYPADTRFCPVDGSAVIAKTYKYGDTVVYPKAPLGSRFLASLLDGFISLVLSVPAITLLLGNEPVFAVALSIIPLIYDFIKDGLGRGQSLGKQAFDLMVVYLPRNTPCTIGDSALRCFIGCLLGIIPVVGWFIEPIAILAGETGRRLADLAADTQVIEVSMFNK